MKRFHSLRSAGAGFRLWCCLCLLGLPAGTVAAQEPEIDVPDDAAVGTAAADTLDPAGQPHVRRFPGLPGPDLPWFVISEVTTGATFDRPRGVEDNYLTLELGFMRSLDRYSAWGISASGTWSEDDRYGLHGHYRRWLGRERRFSLDLSPGVWASGASPFDNRWNHFGVSARAALMFEETLGIGMEVDSGNPVNQKAGTEVKTALRAGGYASFVAAGFVALIGVLYAIAASDPNY